ncbi:hypothetical protein B4U80_04316 [Leptotrombidium deliense]|uniref:Importin subunit beta-1/Transportin-1-like TPR repeats domain-containing protein n=1 Tax=Leptotrombidium deliense TaxID=299467 RepID=A0A443S0L6_9ACAR|nr:hypothetical protein B4U80_04316 [Leptotrombidium deliense]
MYCDKRMTMLMEYMLNNSVHRCVKPPILNVFVDVALAIGTEFAKYSPALLQAWLQASQFQVDCNDYDLVEHVNELRENCIETYRGVVL